MLIMVREMKVNKMLPDLRFWARSMRVDPASAAVLVEQTLELAIENFDVFIRSHERLWLFKVMQDIQCGRQIARTAFATA
ncbi:hypothetical protein [Ensifer sp.]|uniref:hypothetical protein n=1 Tax=Ensifer sp. TaxID=1872086 RepID=UPI003917FE23